MAMGNGVSRCQNLKPAINIKMEAKSIINAAVPRSSTIIKAAVRAIIAQIGMKRRRYKFRLSLNLSQKAAMKKITAHFASSDGWKLTEAGPIGILSQRRARFTSVPIWGIRTIISSAVERINK